MPGPGNKTSDTGDGSSPAIPPARLWPPGASIIHKNDNFPQVSAFCQVLTATSYGFSEVTAKYRCLTACRAEARAFFYPTILDFWSPPSPPNSSHVFADLHMSGRAIPDPANESVSLGDGLPFPTRARVISFLICSWMSSSSSSSFPPSAYSPPNPMLSPRHVTLVLCDWGGTDAAKAAVSLWQYHIYLHRY